MAKESAARKKKTAAPPPLAPAPPPMVEAEVDLFGLGDDGGMSLEDLAKSYADLMNRGPDPYAAQPAPQQVPVDAPADLPLQEALAAEEPPPDDDGQVSPLGILEALLFVGHPQNEPLTARHLAALMRGVSPLEVDELLQELQAAYDEEGTAYTIVSENEGYRLALRPEFAPVRDKFYGRIKEAKLSQGAVDVLAIVAYHQPATAEQVNNLRGRPSGGLLNQLVRRELLRIERPTDTPRQPKFLTTDRFLTLFGLDSLDDLPQSQDPEGP